jgi:hypothetical protein
LHHYRAAPAAVEITASMSRKGNCYDDAMETLSTPSKPGVCVTGYVQHAQVPIAISWLYRRLL